MIINPKVNHLEYNFIAGKKMELNPQLNLSTLSSKTIEPNVIRVRPQSVSMQGLECRICLQSMQKDDLLDVCKCRGSSANVHQNCLVEWIKKAGKYKFWMGEYYTACQICKANIYLETETKYRWIRSQEVGTVLFNRHRCCTILTFLSIFCNFVAIVIISFLSSISQVGITSSVFVIAYCIVVGLILLTFIVYVVKCMIVKDVAEIKLGKRKKRANKMPVKKTQVDDGDFVLQRGTTMDSLYPQRSKNILIN